MVLSIIADSHDHLDNLKRVVDIFTAKNVKHIIHIHEPDLVDILTDTKRFNLITYGHTHEPTLKKVRETLIVNPGKLCGWCYSRPTVALVDLKNTDGEIIKL